jgi:hypothetical protein
LAAIRRLVKTGATGVLGVRRTQRGVRAVQWDIHAFSGEVVATDHVEEVSGQTVSGSGSMWTDVHRELWIRSSSGTERWFTFTNVTFPVREGHRMTVLILESRLRAIINFSTEQYINLVTPRDFELFSAAEAFAFAGLLVAAGLTGLAGLVALSLGAASYCLLKWSIRRQRLCSAVFRSASRIRQRILVM